MCYSGTETWWPQKHGVEFVQNTKEYQESIGVREHKQDNGKVAEMDTSTLLSSWILRLRELSEWLCLLPLFKSAVLSYGFCMIDTSEWT